MNIFVLNTGRCGSTTFIKACEHIINYTSGHETLIKNVGDQRLNYPPQHIEADNRLAWFLARLEKKYADKAFYVHLKRNKHDTIASFARRLEYGIMKAYKEGVLLGGEENVTAEQVAEDYIETVDSNITMFLSNKTNKMEFNLESAQDDFSDFWYRIAAKGNIEAALEEWNINYNAS